MFTLGPPRLPKPPRPLIHRKFCAPRQEMYHELCSPTFCITSLSEGSKVKPCSEPSKVPRSSTERKTVAKTNLMFTFTFLSSCQFIENAHYLLFSDPRKKILTFLLLSIPTKKLTFFCRKFPGNVVANSRYPSLFWKHRSLFSSWPKAQEMFRKRVQEMLRPIHFLGADTNPPAGSL